MKQREQALRERYGLLPGQPAESLGQGSYKNYLYAKNNLWWQPPPADYRPPLQPDRSINPIRPIGQ